MLNFRIDKQTCIKCGQCAMDCPAKIIEMIDQSPVIPADKEASCYKCQHCFAICPSGALSIHGLDPADSQLLSGKPDKPIDADQMELLIKGRRSVRRYLPENLEPALMQRLLEVAQYAPTAINANQVRFAVVDNMETMARIRGDVLAGLARLEREGSFPLGREFFGEFVHAWEVNQMDVIFRKAPHMVIASAPETVAAPIPDCFIALSYFDLFAQSLGAGTLWCGLAKWALCDLLPEMKKRLGIPDDHVFGYVMLFGKPAVKYARTVQRGPANVARVKW